MSWKGEWKKETYTLFGLTEKKKERKFEKRKLDKRDFSTV